MTSTLRAPDLRAVLEYTSATLAVDDFAQMQPQLLGPLARLVGCEAVTLTHIDLRSGQEVAVFWPPSRPNPAMVERYAAIAGQHPLRRTIEGQVRSGRLEYRPVRISDLLTRRQWRQSPMYTEVLRGIDDQMCLPLFACGSAVHAVTLARTGGSFSQRQSELLVGSGRHIASALQRANRRDRPALQIAPSMRWLGADACPGIALAARPAISPPPRVAALTLSDRERQVLSLVATGMTDAQVARKLRLSPTTVSRHLHRIYTRLGVPNRVAAVQRWNQLCG